MNCAIGEIKVQQDNGSIRGIEIIPEGCQPVSEDTCKSGYMAPSENVSFPKDALEQCCKCKEGETCSLCKDPDVCTEDEKEEFVAGDECFGTSMGPSQENSFPDTPEEALNFIEENLIYIIGGSIITLFVLMFLFSRRSKTF
jgi:hypothetical protein